MDFGNNVIPFPGRHAPRTGRPTFIDLAREWLRTEGARLVCPDNERRHVEHLRAIWVHTESELRPRVVKEALANLLGSLSAATVNKIRGTGRRIIREAQLNDAWIGPNPFDVVRRQREARPSHRVLSLAECRILIPHLREDRRREALVMLYLGLRPGEWKALQRADVDLRAETITIRRSNGRNSTKTGKVRTVPVPAGLRSVLIEALEASPADCNLLFPAAGGKLQRADAKLSRMLKAAMVRAGLVSGWTLLCRRKGCGYKESHQERHLAPCPKCGMKLWAVGVPLPVRFYDLRHSAATLHREAGADPLAIQLVLGHTPENVTDSVYTHLSMDYLRREMNRLTL